MKKLVLAVFIVFSAYSLRMASAADEGFKLVISETPPQEILSMAASSPVTETGRFKISSKDDGIPDYGIHVYVKKDSPTPDVPDAFMLVSLTPALDEKGEAVPDKYKTKLMGLVFIDEELAWFASEEVRLVFIKVFE